MLYRFVAKKQWAYHIAEVCGRLYGTI